MNIEYLPHTADIRMKIEGDTLQELFLAGLMGMSQILCENRCGEVQEFSKRAAVSLRAPDLTCLLIDFLSDVLSLTYTDKVLYCRMEDIRISDTTFSTKLLGIGIDKLDEEIKAVTYHEAQVAKNDNNVWESLIVFDI